MLRFEMAKSLVARARERAKWIGDDHGDPYEEALLSRSISTEMKIAVKEVLDHLRSALDYAAREVCEVCGTVPSSAKVYFPIVARTFDSKDFRSRVGKLMPGVLQTRPELVAVLESFQPFASPGNGWLADLGTLANETKHIQLSVNEVSEAKFTITRGENHPVLGEIPIISARKANGEPFRRSPLMLVEGLSEGSEQGRYIYIGLSLVDEELLYFLDASINGVDEIINKLSDALATGPL